MAVKTIAKCVTCGYPIAVEYAGQQISCPYCGTINQVVSQGVTIPTWVFAGSIGLLAGVLLGPAIIGSTEGGARWLERQAREKLAK